MAKKARKLTLQEQMVAAYAAHSISSAAVFHPDQWRSGNEPADMILLIGRSLILVNMHQSKAYFDDLCSHNNVQAIKRIAEWKSGRQIRGRNKWRRFAIDSDDVDQIAVISVIDGPHAACSYHDVELTGFGGDVALCASLTSRVMFEFANKGGGARDVLHFCASMKDRGKLTEEQACEEINSYYTFLDTSARAAILREPQTAKHMLIDGKYVPVFDAYKLLFEDLRRQSEEIFNIFPDMSWTEVFHSTAFIVNTIAQIENAPYGAVVIKCIGDKLRFLIVVSTNSKALAENTDRIMEMMKEHDCAFTFKIMLFNGFDLKMLAVDPEKRVFAIDKELGGLLR